MITWKLLHTFGFVAWFVGLLSTTGLQVFARKAQDATARQTAWAALRRFVPYEVVGMILTPISGLFLAKTIYGAFVPPKVIFVHIKLTLVLLAVIGNLVLFRMRPRAALLAPDGGPAYDRALRRIAAVQGITTLMLPLAVIVVIIFRYRVG